MKVLILCAMVLVMSCAIEEKEPFDITVVVPFGLTINENTVTQNMINLNIHEGISDMQFEIDRPLMGIGQERIRFWGLVAPSIRSELTEQLLIAASDR